MSKSYRWGAVTALVLVLLAPASAHAQRGAASPALVLVLLAPASAHAQRGAASPASGGTFAVAPYAGYLVSQSFVEGPLDITLGAVGAPLFGVQVGLPIASFASLVGSVGYASGDLNVGLPFIGGIGVGKTNALLADAALELRAPAGRIVPVAQLGGGALRREVSVAGVSADATDYVVTGGLGADVPIMPSLSLRVFAKDYWGRSDFGGVGDLRARTGDLHNLAFTAGLRFTF